MILSKNNKNLIGQGMFQIKQEAESYERLHNKKLLHFEIGDSYFNSPEEVKDECIKAIQNNKTHYVSSYGLFELREAIAKNHNVDINNIIICPANFGIFATLSVVCDRGDNINYPTPGFPTYKAVAKYLGLNLAKNDFKCSISCFPNNPDGKYVYNSEKGKINIYDMAYENIIYEDFYFDIEKLNLDNDIYIHSFSKTHSMSGFRLGYVIANEEVINKIALLIETTVSCFPEFIQYAGIKALEIKNYKLKELKERRNLMFNILKKYYKVQKPTGGLYLWCECNNDKTEFKKLLRKGIVVCPGKLFGDKYYIRFCFAKSTKDINQLKEKLK